MPKLLIVEDEPILREMYLQGFSKEGIEVLAAKTAEEGLVIAKEQPLDLILLDVLLPNASGIEMLEKLRQDEQTKDIRVVVFSNYDTKQSKEKALALDALDYLIKTNYTPQEIIKKVKQYLK